VARTRLDSAANRLLAGRFVERSATLGDDAALLVGQAAHALDERGDGGAVRLVLTRLADVGEYTKSSGGDGLHHMGKGR
jgi:hypothetical protein